MITVPPRHYCIVENPVLKDKTGKVILDEHGQAKLKHADLVSFSQAIFEKFFTKKFMLIFIFAGVNVQ